MPQFWYRSTRAGDPLVCRTVLVSSEVVAILVLALFTPPFSRAQSASEYQVKAAYLYNFAKLTEWPAQAFPSDTSNLTICVFGGDEDFVGVLHSATTGKIINRHPLIVKHVWAAAELHSCQMVFFHGRLREIRSAISEVNTAGILLAGEDPDFLSSGGMISLLLRNGKVTYEVNPEAMARAGVRFGASVQVSSQAATPNPVMDAGDGRQVISQMAPAKPELARKMNLTGVVQLKVVVRADGTVKDVQVLGGHPVLAAASTQAVMKWRFEPGPRETTQIVKINFAD